MNWIDFVIIALLAFGLIQGFIDGLIIEIAELAALDTGYLGSHTLFGLDGRQALRVV